MTEKQGIEPRPDPTTPSFIFDPYKSALLPEPTKIGSEENKNVHKDIQHAMNKFNNINYQNTKHSNNNKFMENEENDNNDDKTDLDKMLFKEPQSPSKQPTKFNYETNSYEDPYKDHDDFVDALPEKSSGFAPEHSGKLEPPDDTFVIQNEGFRVEPQGSYRPTNFGSQNKDNFEDYSDRAEKGPNFGVKNQETDSRPNVGVQRQTQEPNPDIFTRQTYKPTFMQTKNYKPTFLEFRTNNPFMFDSGQHSVDVEQQEKHYKPEMKPSEIITTHQQTDKNLQTDQKFVFPKTDNFEVDESEKETTTLLKPDKTEHLEIVETHSEIEKIATIIISTTTSTTLTTTTTIEAITAAIITDTTTTTTSTTETTTTSITTSSTTSTTVSETSTVSLSSTLSEVAPRKEIQPKELTTAVTETDPPRSDKIPATDPETLFSQSEEPEPSKILTTTLLPTKPISSELDTEESSRSSLELPITTSSSLTTTVKESTFEPSSKPASSPPAREPDLKPEISSFSDQDWEPEEDKQIKTKTTPTFVIPILMTNKQGIEVKPGPETQDRDLNKVVNFRKPSHPNLPENFQLDDQAAEEDKSETRYSEKENADALNPETVEYEKDEISKRQFEKLENNLDSEPNEPVPTNPNQELYSPPKVLGAGFNFFSGQNNPKFTREKLPELNQEKIGSLNLEPKPESGPESNSLEPLTQFFQNRDAKNKAASIFSSKFILTFIVINCFHYLT